MFTVVTDHSALQWVITNHLIWCALQLRKYNLIVEYRKGKLNTAPDTLSQIIPSLYSNKKDVSTLPVTNKLIWEKQHSDPEIVKILQAHWNNGEAQYHRSYKINFTQKTQLSESFHYHLFIPKDLGPCILEHYHCSPMSGLGEIYKTYKGVQDVA